MLESIGECESLYHQTAAEGSLLKSPVGLNAWRKRFIARVLVLSVLSQVPAVLVWSRAFGAPLGLVVALHLFGLLVTVRRLVYWNDDVAAPWWRTWLLEVPYGGYGSGCFVAGPLLLVAFAFALPYRAVVGHAPMPWMTLLTAVQCLAWAMALWGTTLGRMVPWTRRHDVLIEGLPRAFDGYRIVQLSDIHCGPYVPRWLLKYWVSRASAHAPDLVAVTGDLIAAGSGYLDDVTWFHSLLKARDGVAVCLGNHDYFATEGVAAAVEAGGATLLRNDGITLRRGDEALYLAGIDDRWSHRDDVPRALAGRPPGAPVVMLAHDPQQFPEIADAGAALVLSGHTHGGQVAVPFLARWLNVARFKMRFTKGLYQQRQSTLFVHAGLGTSGPPTRIGVAPEIGVLVLRCAPQSASRT